MNTQSKDENRKILLVRGISLPFKEDESAAYAEALRRAEGVIPVSSVLGTSVYKRSVDARHNDNIKFLYTIAIEVCSDAKPEMPEKSTEFSLLDDEMPMPERGGEKLRGRPVVIGFGPAGIFASLMLAEHGYKPIVLERGGSIAERTEAVRSFYKRRVLDRDSNIQFGAGGAGTFSDGKLTTRIGDRRCRAVLDMFVRLGAPEDILVNAKPHIGTDKLRTIVDNAEKRLLELGGEIRYRTRVEDIPLSDGRVCALKTSEGELPCGAVVLAVGHSARDVYSMLSERGYSMTPKPFSMGVRVEHLQRDIDAALYGRHAGNELLPPAEYTLSRRFGGGAVYSFCMCPGGEVVAAASEDGGLVVNGMSSYERNGRNANSAIAVSLDTLSSPLAQIELQRRIERAAFAAGGGDYSAPIQTLGDFLSGNSGTEPSRVTPTYMEGSGTPATRTADLSALIRDNLGEKRLSMMRDSFRAFGRQIRGFDAPFAVLTGMETRTSAPVRITRGEGFTADGADNLYPCGEGAGYAGGIMSAAVDGIRCAEAIIRRYAPLN